MNPLHIVLFFLPSGEAYQSTTHPIEVATAWLPNKTYAYQPFKQQWWVLRRGRFGTSRGILSPVPLRKVPPELQTKALLLI